MSKYRVEEYVDEHIFYAEQEVSPGVWKILGRYHDQLDAERVLLEQYCARMDAKQADSLEEEEE